MGAVPVVVTIAGPAEVMLLKGDAVKRRMRVVDASIENGDHYVIPFGQIEAIKTWATEQGYLSGTSPGH